MMEDEMVGQFGSWKFKVSCQHGLVRAFLQVADF